MADSATAAAAAEQKVAGAWVAVASVPVKDMTTEEVLENPERIRDMINKAVGDQEAAPMSTADVLENPEALKEMINRAVAAKKRVHFADNIQTSLPAPPSGW